MIKVTRLASRALDMWEETLVPVQGPVLSSWSPRNASDGCISHVGPAGSVERSALLLAHQLPGDAGRVSSSETLSPRPNRPPCVVRTDNIAVVYYINHQGGLRSPVQAGHQRSWYNPRITNERVLYPGTQHGRLSSEAGPEDGCLPRKAADFESLLAGVSSATLQEWENPLGLVHHPLGLERHGTDVAEASSVRFSRSLCSQEFWRGCAGRGPPLYCSPHWPAREHGSRA
ncbi:CinA-like protein [Labeo rohita]|uniref:CinA-like protein n=1 Tax=Labeo rohita TaxID=84645 RepID=A0ABQ8L9I3_LABRO|nr:CinA-like protein [Labeo rohita]